MRSLEFWIILLEKKPVGNAVNPIKYLLIIPEIQDNPFFLQKKNPIITRFKRLGNGVGLKHPARHNVTRRNRNIRHLG